MNFKSMPFLVLFIILGAVGITAAYGAIILAGDTVVEGAITADNYFDNGNSQFGSGASALGGFGNSADQDFSTVGGGQRNFAAGISATVGGGSDNLASEDGATVGGGDTNRAIGLQPTVGGGQDNIASGNWITIGGGQDNNANGDWSTIGGGNNNQAIGESATVAGGTTNLASGDRSTIGGGGAGGFSNTASGDFSTIGGGAGNRADGDRSTIGGGFGNLASQIRSTVGGGSGNDAIGPESTVGGGFGNVASGTASTIPGGEGNEASGDFSFAAGRNAKAIHQGAFVWADSTNADFESDNVNKFFVRASGGARIYTDASLSNGVLLFPGGSDWFSISDSRLKDNIAEYSVLDKLDDYRAVEFDWKEGGNHDVGVMAQELHSIFPELVNAGSNEGDIANAADPGVWSVQYSKLGALALQAIKEQQTQIDEQNKLINFLVDIICEENPEREICLEN